MLTFGSHGSPNIDLSRGTHGHIANYHNAPILSLVIFKYDYGHTILTDSYDTFWASVHKIVNK